MLTTSTLPGFCALLQTILCAPLSTSHVPTSHDTSSAHNIFDNPQEMPPSSSPGGFVPPYVLKEITKSEACSPENKRAAADTLRYDESRAMTPKSSQDRQDARRRDANSSTDGDAESGKSDDGMESRTKDARGTTTHAGGGNPFKQAAEKPKQTGAN